MDFVQQGWPDHQSPGVNQTNGTCLKSRKLLSFVNSDILLALRDAQMHHEFSVLELCHLSSSESLPRTLEVQDVKNLLIFFQMID